MFLRSSIKPLLYKSISVLDSNFSYYIRYCYYLGLSVSNAESLKSYYKAIVGIGKVFNKENLD